MSGAADNFEEETDALADVRPAGLGEYLHEYTGVLAETDERVRIVTLPPELTDIDAAVDAFSQASDQWYNASANANIVSIRERGTEPQPWISMPDNGGDTLASIQPNLSPGEIETVISETAEALRTLGLYNTVHGFLSPDDIYLTDAGDETTDITAELGRFGLKAAIQAAVGEFTPTAYTAPELLDNPDQPTEQTDVYGLAAVTYFALTGHPPIGDADLTSAIRNGVATPPSTYAGAIPGDLDDVVMQALSTRPDDRYDSPYTFGRAFVSAFAPDDFRPDNTGKDTGEEAETADSDKSPADTPGEDDDASFEMADGSTVSEDTDGASVTRRTAVGLLSVGVLGGVGWFLSHEQLTAADPAEETGNPNPSVAPTANISVTPVQPSIGEEVTFSAAESTTADNVSIETYEWALGSNAQFATGGETFIQTFNEPGEKAVRLRITDSQDRSAIATATLNLNISGKPMFRYDVRNTGTTPDETGPQTSVDEQWSYETDFKIFSSPAVVDGTVYVGSRDRSVYAVSADDGTEQWSYQTGAGVFSSPVVVDDTVYVGSDDNNVYALSADDGTEQWSFQTGGFVASAPAVVGDIVYFGSNDSNVYALSVADGTQQWSYQTRSFVASAPTVVGTTVYFGSGDNSVYALSVADGTEQWSYRTGNSIASGAAVVNGTVYVGSRDSNVYALSADDGTEQWVYQTGGGITSSTVVVDGTVYVGSRDSNVYALSADDGTEQWVYETGRDIVSSPAVVDNTVYVGSDDSNLYALAGQ